MQPEYQHAPARPGTVQLRRPNVAYSGITVYGPAVTSEYDGLEVRADRRLSKNMLILGSFTWSRSFDDGTPQDPNNIKGSGDRLSSTCPFIWLSVTPTSYRSGKPRHF